ncbi:MAG TPA: hypothetical protein VEK57_30160 [Thermoanaerobaculia bacterium]|nr:hypothetical protein [Thermoanaerobaculia bacterium]
MKRSAFDLLRRAFDNALANWPLLLLRLAEAIVFFVIAIAALLAIVVPILVSVGIQFANLNTPESIEEAIFTLAQKWILLIWILLGVSILFLVFLAVHAFVEAGCARVLVDGERNAGPALEGPRSRYRVFSMERWFSGGAEGWWTLFWIYNLAWAAASVILLIPLLPTIVLMLVLGGNENPAAAAGIGCLGLVLTLFLGILIAIVTSIWTTRAIADWAARPSGARHALATAWAAVKADFGRHLVIALAVVVVAMAGSAFFSSLSFFAGMGDIFGRGHSSVSFFLVPLQMFGSLLNSVFSSAVFSWFLAAYAALALERAE